MPLERPTAVFNLTRSHTEAADSQNKLYSTIAVDQNSTGGRHFIDCQSLKSNPLSPLATSGIDIDWLYLACPRDKSATVNWGCSDGIVRLIVC
jgi:hypothetical protein